jgi:hypothetical protein
MRQRQRVRFEELRIPRQQQFRLREVVFDDRLFEWVRLLRRLLFPCVQ